MIAGRVGFPVQQTRDDGAQFGRAERFLQRRGGAKFPRHLQRIELLGGKPDIARIGIAGRSVPALRIVSNPSISGMKMSVISKQPRSIARQSPQGAAAVAERQHFVPRGPQHSADRAEQPRLIIDDDDLCHPAIVRRGGLRQSPRKA